MVVSIKGGTQNGWFMREYPIYNWMIKGYPYFKKRPYTHDIHWWGFMCHIH